MIEKINNLGKICLYIYINALQEFKKIDKKLSIGRRTRNSMPFLRVIT